MIFVSKQLKGSRRNVQRCKKISSKKSSVVVTTNSTLNNNTGRVNGRVFSLPLVMTAKTEYSTKTSDLTFEAPPIMQKIFYKLGVILRETGDALEKAGCFLQGDLAYKEEMSRHRRVMYFGGNKPKFGSKVFVAPNASIIGSVELGDNTSIWYGAVLRGDVQAIKIGTKSSIGDRTVVHVTRPSAGTAGLPCLIGNHVTIGSGCTIHACTIEDKVIIEPGSTVLDGSIVGSGSVLGPGSLVPPQTVIPSGEYWAGSPAKFIRKVLPEETKAIEDSAENHRILGDRHREATSLTAYEREVEEMAALGGKGDASDPKDDVNLHW